MHICKMALLTAVLMLWSWLSSAQELVTIDLATNTNTDLSYQTLHDLDGDYEIENVLAFDHSKWTSHQADVSRGVLTHPVWMRFSVTNSSKNQSHYILEHTDPGPYKIDIFIVDEAQQKILTSQHYHRESPYWERPFPNPGPAFQIQVEHTENVFVYARIQATFGGLFSQFAIWTPRDFVRYETVETFLYGGAYTAFLIFSFLALMIFFAVKERSFLSYSALTFTSCMLLLNLDAHWSFLFQASGAPVGNATFWGGIYYFAALTFVRDFLKLKTHAPFADKTYLLLISFGPTTVILGLLGYAEAAGVFMMLTGPILLTVPFLALYLCIRKSIKAKLFTIAWFIYGFSILIQFGLRQVGLVEHKPLTLYTGAIGGVIEMCLLAFSMGLKVLDIRKERDQARDAHVQHLENFSENLEKQVKEKTKELELARAAAEREARTDSLTGLHNRRAFEEMARHKIRSVLEHKKVLATILVDIDKFKLINDKFGHEGGDYVLNAVAHSLNKYTKESDLLARMGGEEFAILFEAESESHAIQHCELLRTQVAKLNIQAIGIDRNTTISVGCYCTTQSVDLSSMLNRADMAMYQSKRGGRNRTTLWQLPSSSDSTIEAETAS